MKSPLHVIQVIADSGPGGAPTHVLQLTDELQKQSPDYQLSLIAPRGWITENADPAVHVYPTEITSAVGRTSHRLFRASLKQAMDAAPDLPTIIHFHGVRAGTLGYLNFRYRGRGKAIPMVYTEHLWTRDYHLDNRLRELLQLRLLSGVGHRANRIIAVSQAVATFLLEKKLVSPEHLVIIPNGVQVPKKPTYAGRSKDCIIGSVGSLVPLKGYATLITAMAQVNQKFPNVRLEIIGDGPEKKTLEQQVRTMHLTDHVQFLGSQKDPSTNLRNWDIFVSTSLSESFGLGIAEAMAEGLPIVATHVGGIPELVTQETGRLVPPKDPEMLAEAIIKLLENLDLRRQLGTHGHDRITKNFTIQEMTRKTRDLYRSLIKYEKTL